MVRKALTILKAYVLVRLKQKTTWVLISSLLGTAGVVIAPEKINLILTFLQ